MLSKVTGGGIGTAIAVAGAAVGAIVAGAGATVVGGGSDSVTTVGLSGAPSDRGANQSE
jgi:hypothetical protein